MTTVIKQDDVSSVADALRLYLLPSARFIQAVNGKRGLTLNAMAQYWSILVCVLKGIVHLSGYRYCFCCQNGCAFWGDMAWRYDWSSAGLPDFASVILADPDGARKNTGDNTPAVTKLLKMDIHVAPRWREWSEVVAMLNPSDLSLLGCSAIIVPLGNGIGLVYTEKLWSLQKLSRAYWYSGAMKRRVHQIVLKSCS